tara:strand:+ start:979 stop:1269 length:291 start_codon:yes stop_codon:yes gene_type:complete
MKESDLKYLTHCHYVISELENTIDELKKQKEDFIKDTEKRFRRNCSLKEAQARFKYYLEKNPKSEEMLKIKSIEKRLRHVVKQLEIKRELVNKITK